MITTFFVFFIFIHRRESVYIMIRKLREEINQYFIGKEEVVDDVIICLLAGGHVLLEDVPGVGKTTLARTLSKATDCKFGRIQFTPDTLPGDVTGVSIFNMNTNEFEYREGAIMNQIVLADEINRTSPKTQASLLEAMAEGQVTVDGKVYKLPEPFMVIATQNPVEFLGTYPLPEAQLDRFMMRLSVGYPNPDEELKMAQNFLAGKRESSVQSICTSEEILKMREEVDKVQVADSVIKYIQGIIDDTRKETAFVLGASPRALLALIKASQAKAYLMGRDFVKPDDVKAVAVNCLHHRIKLTSEAKIRKENIDKLIQGIVVQGKVPVE